MLYAFTENFVLPLSHDEVVHGKGSLLGQDARRRRGRSSPTCACCSATCTPSPARSCCSWAASSASGASGTTTAAWTGTCSSTPSHAGVQRWWSDLNRLYRDEPALHELDCDPAGFEWIDANDADSSVISFLRQGRTTGDDDAGGAATSRRCRAPATASACRAAGFWREMLNSDGGEYGGSGLGNSGGVMAGYEPAHGRDVSLNLILPPLAALFFKSEG